MDEVYDYREHVDEAVDRLLERADAGRTGDLEEIRFRTEIGLHHEQQHQELLLTDIKHVFGVNPARPAYREDAAPEGGAAPPLEWLSFDGGLVEIGHRGPRFCFDNETPRHREYREEFRLASRPVTCGEWLEFIRDGG